MQARILDGDSGSRLATHLLIQYKTAQQQYAQEDQPGKGVCEDQGARDGSDCAEQRGCKLVG